MVRRENFSSSTPPPPNPNPPTPPNTPRRQHFRGKYFRCPFHYPNVPLEAGAPPPQSFDASYTPAQLND